MTAKRKTGVRLLALMLIVLVFSTASMAEAKSQGSSGQGAFQKASDNQADPQREGQADPSADALQCHWILEVDGTVERDIDGVKHAYHLLILMEKMGGTDKLGTYSGKLFLKTEQDVASVEEEVFGDGVGLEGTNIIDSHADNATINVLSFAGDVFAAYGFEKDSPDAPLAPLAPIGEYDAMALERPEFTHTQQYNVVVTFEDGETTNLNDEKVFTQPMIMKILIIGADVRVFLPELDISESFKGTITGIPIAQ